MKVMPTLAATALLALLAAPAFAQTMPADSTPAAPVNAMPTDSTPPAATAAPSATDAGTPVSATVQTVTNGPVPDTPATRAMYKPLSHAGRHTKPAGN